MEEWRSRRSANRVGHHHRPPGRLIHRRRHNPIVAASPAGGGRQSLKLLAAADINLTRSAETVPISGFVAMECIGRYTKRDIEHALARDPKKGTDPRLDNIM